MENILIKDYRTMDGEKQGEGKDSFTYKPIITPADPAAKDFHMAFIEVEPGHTAYAYHFHECGEEVFYIISGEGSVRTKDGDVAVKAGMVVGFPTGPEGAHCITNTSETEKLIYIDIDAHKNPDIIHYPDTGKLMLVSPYTFGMFNEQK